MRRFDNEARQALRNAGTEAKQRGDRHLGTEHLLLAVLAVPDLASATDLDAVMARAALNQLDHDALSAVGIDTGRIDDTPVLDGRTSLRTRNPRRFTRGARQVVVAAAQQAAHLGESTITSRQLLLGLLDTESPDVALQVLRRLGVDTDQLRARLAPSQVS